MQVEVTKFWTEGLFKLRTEVGTVQIRMSCPRRTMDEYFFNCWSNYTVLLLFYLSTRQQDLKSYGRICL